MAVNVNSVSSEGVVSATTVKSVNFINECEKFRIRQIAIATENLCDYFEYVKELSNNFTKQHSVAFEYKKDWREEWKKYITEKYGQSIEAEALEFFDNHLYRFVSDSSISLECEKYANEHDWVVLERFIGNEDYFYIIEQLDAVHNDIHRLSTIIRDYISAYKNAMRKDIVEYKGEVDIPFSRFRQSDIDILIEKEDVINNLVCLIGSEQMIDDIEVDDDNECITVYFDC